MVTLTDRPENLDGIHVPVRLITPIELYIQVGNASAETIAEVLSSLSGLYRACGGSGLTFDLVEVRGDIGKFHARPRGGVD